MNYLELQSKGFSGTFTLVNEQGKPIERIDSLASKAEKERFANAVNQGETKHNQTVDYWNKCYGQYAPIWYKKNNNI